MKQKTKLEILEETVAYYSENTTRRSVFINDAGDEFCRYVHEGKYCAVGRCFTDEVKADPDAFFVEGVSAHRLIVDVGERTLFKPEYRGHNIAFWERLQSLHDGDVFWDENGLTALGRDQYELLVSSLS
jgi:hypothetical protein